jgi:hypothetical protein
MGVYRHYKGPLYQVIGLAHDANAEDFFDYSEITPKFWDGTVGRDAKYERICVVYISLELNGAHFGPRLAVRTLDDFTAKVAAQDAAGNTMRHTVPRFEYLGPVLTPEMLLPS